VDVAIDHFRRAAFMKRPLHVAHSNLLMAMMHSDRVTPEQLLREHKLWAERFTPEHDFPAPAIEDPNPDRPIRVGYVSPDFRNHPVAMFALPVLSNHDRSRVHVTCYDDAAVDDEVKRLLQATGHRWVRSSGFSFEQLFAAVRADKIDILIDLAVHSDCNRLPVFAARAAPIQMTWLGYAGSTGCAAVDYRITDPIVDPPGLTDHHFTERLLRLPEIFWCFGPPESQNEVTIDPPPPRADGRIRFGTATRLAKVSPTCLDLWAALLRRVESAVLVLSAEPLADASIRDEWLGHFASRGVPADRVELHPARNYRGYLQFLASLDIGLDTFPFNGGTTVCQTMWMGTPVVALAGSTSVSRVTMSILANLGLNDLIAPTAEVWVDVNAGLAADGSRRAELRSTLRQQIKASPLGDAPRFTRHLEQAFRGVFQDECRKV
jgi:protein O-GlcNAc transferase